METDSTVADGNDNAKQAAALPVVIRLRRLGLVFRIFAVLTILGPLVAGILMAPPWILGMFALLPAVLVAASGLFFGLSRMHERRAIADLIDRAA